MDLLKLASMVKEKGDTASILHVSEDGEISELKVTDTSGVTLTEKKSADRRVRSRSQKRNVECSVCGKIMSDRRNLNRHLRTIHGVQPKIKKAKIKCSFTDECTFLCATSTLLRQHLESVHGFNIIEEHLHFENRADFDKWKEEEEIRTCTSYVTDTGVKYRRRKKIYYLRCHRSGPVRAEQNSKTERLRSKPLRGYTQCGLTCPSSMQLVESQNGSIDVQYFPKHLGHDTDDESVKYIKLRRKEKEEIAAKIVQGVPVGKIVKEARIRKGKKLSRVNLLQRRDVYNIKSKVGFIEKETDHDGKIIDSWIKHLHIDSLNNNPIALYKPIDKNNDYLLVIIHYIQKIIYTLQYDGSIIYVKTKKGKANVDFNFTVVYIINENGEGYPLAFCISSKIDYSTLSLFFQVLRESFGIITTQIFISDNISYYYIAWKNIMKESEIKLICNFNILSVWEQKLIELKCPLKKLNFVSQRLKCLLNEMDPDAFEYEAVQLLNSWNEDADLKPFLKFFYKCYFKKPSEWANCYRVHLVRKENINKYLEPLHNYLENIYDEGTHNLRNALSSILFLIRNECYLEMFKWDEDFANNKVKEIERNHIASKEISNIEFNGVEWIIPNTESNYIVRKGKGSCEKQCNIVCYSCDICIHSYICVCGDYLINFNICSHIHAVAAYNSLQHIDAKYASQGSYLASSALKISAVSLSKTVTKYLEKSELTDFEYDKIILHLDKLIKEHSLKDRYEESRLGKLTWNRI